MDRDASPPVPCPSTASRSLLVPALVVLAAAAGAVPGLPGTAGPSEAVAQAAAPYASAPGVEPYDEAARRAGQAAEGLREEQGIPGVSVAVGAGGEVVYAEGFGWSGVERRSPVWPSTKFRIGSVSKPLTSIAVGRLMEEGRLDPDRPVHEIVPYWDEHRWPVTTRQLAGHLAGVRHYREGEFLSRESYPDVEAGVEIFADDTLLFEPGADYSYSSYGWNLVSAVVEEAAGEPFLRHMRRRVIEPMGLDETVADHPDSIVMGRTEFYVRSGEDGGAGEAREAGDERGRLLNAPYVDNSYKWAGGGYLATPSDLVRFGFAMLRSLDPGREGVLEPGTVETMWTSQTTRSGEETGYGIGWSVGRDSAGRRTVGHTGGSVGGTTWFRIYPEQGVVVAITANLSDADLDEAGGEIGRAFLEARSAAGSR